MTTSHKRLIVNADDFGMTPSISRGIIEGHRNGIVTSTSVMITCPGAIEDAQQALRDDPALGLGLHFVLAGEGLRPVSPPSRIPSLMREDGTFLLRQEWLARRDADTLDPADIEREMQAQLAYFVAHLGTQPDHLDSHFHITYQHPAALRMMSVLAQQHQLPIRHVGHELPGAVDALQMMASYGPLPTMPDHFEGRFWDTNATVSLLLEILPQLPPGTTELMCHPGYASDPMPDPYTSERDCELAALTDPQVREIIAREGIELVTFSSLQ
jgi:chitin disaccharide deacetylase